MELVNPGLIESNGILRAEEGFRYYLLYDDIGK